MNEAKKTNTYISSIFNTLFLLLLDLLPLLLLLLLHLLVLEVC